MRATRFVAAVAMCATALSPIAATMAFAVAIPTTTTTDAMQAACVADLASKVNTAATLHDGTLVWSTQYGVTGQSSAAPVEVPGSRAETPGTRFGTGTPTYSNVQIVGDPYKVGGSVNMFGLQGAKNKNWPNSEYDFTALFDTTTTFSYGCTVTEQTETHVDAVPGHYIEGYYQVHKDGHGNEEGTQQSCDAFTALQPTLYDGSDGPPWWGIDYDPSNVDADHGQCDFIKTGDADPGTPEQWIPGAPVVHPELSPAFTIDQTDRASGTGHETNGGPYTEVAPPGTLWNAGQVVICISPSKTVKGGVPGAWANHNGYTGTKCTTAWYTVAPWGAGSQTSNGTLISVPAV
jgi:hypothetical protein